MKPVINNYPRIITPSYKLDIIKERFRRKLGYELNITDPKTFNEKIQWLKLFYRNPLMAKCADKYAVRQYIENKIGKEYLIPLVGKGVYQNADEIDFEALPNKFALKTTDGWETNIICDDKSKLEFDEARRTLYNWLDKGQSHYYRYFEWAYKNIKSRIICEEYIEQTGGLIDYKFWCFGGRVEAIVVCTDRSTGKLKYDYFDRNWNLLELRTKAPSSNRDIPAPKNLKQMIAFAEKLTVPFPFARADFYEICGEIRIGEITFYPLNGTAKFYPEEWDLKFGELIKLPKKSFIPPFEINKRKSPLRQNSHIRLKGL